MIIKLRLGCWKAISFDIVFFSYDLLPSSAGFDVAKMQFVIEPLE
jgi:hypothetical protein